MATYAIGDVHGCYESLQKLLKVIEFDRKNDKLWFVGDLVGKGPESAKVLKFLYRIRKVVTVVLGNHDLCMLSVYHEVAPKQFTGNFKDILILNNSYLVVQWLLEQPLAHYDAHLGYLMVHAGCPPMWSLADMLGYSAEISNILRSKNSVVLLKHMFGNYPDIWDADAHGFLRWRVIVNYFTRMRFCKPDGTLNLVANGVVPPGEEYKPWFNHKNIACESVKVIFGHWAALHGKTRQPHIFAMDTGCVYGNKLKAMRLEDQQIFMVDKVECSEK